MKNSPEALCLRLYNSPDFTNFAMKKTNRFIMSNAKSKQK